MAEREHEDPGAGAADGTVPHDAGGEAEHVILGERVRLPLHVRDAGTIAASFLVPTRFVRTLLPDALDPAPLLPGRTLCTVVGVRYRDNPLGAYDEVGISYVVRERAGGTSRLDALRDVVRGRAGAFIRHLPVTTEFSCEAGRQIWGFPKFVARIAFRDDGPRRAVTLAADGSHVLTLTVTRRGVGRDFHDVPLTAYSNLDGVARRTRFVASGRGVGMRPGGATLELGDHPIADELRSLGLPRRALTSAWIEHMEMRFGAAEKL